MKKKEKNKSAFSKSFGLILFIFLHISCDHNVNEEQIKYVIINESDYYIRITPIPSINFRNTKEQITLNRDEIYSETRLWNERFDANQSFSTFLGTDSVKIEFDDERKIIYSSLTNNSLNNCNESRNLLRSSPKNGSNYVEYIFTNDDFDCALVCQEECF